MREFPFPDFGFSVELNYSDTMTDVWHLLFDHINAHPKYERLKVLIEDMTNQKLVMIQ